MSISSISFVFSSIISSSSKLPPVDDFKNDLTNPISRPFLMMYHDDNMTEASKAYIDFVLSKEGQDIVEAKVMIKF